MADRGKGAAANALPPSTWPVRYTQRGFHVEGTMELDQIQTLLAEGIDGTLQVQVPGYDSVNVSPRWVDIRALWTA